MSSQVNRSALIDTLEASVEQHIQQAVKVFQNLDEETLLKPAANGGWSIAQCLWHLNSYGDYYLPYIQKAVSKQDPGGEVFNSGWLGTYFIRMMQPGSGKKYKAFKDHVPPLQPDVYVVVSEFIRQQEVLINCLRQARTADLRVKIPISISKLVKLKLGDVLQFLIAHNERHVQQALSSRFHV